MDKYPLTVVTVSIPSYKAHGGEYTLTLPTGETATLYDGEEEYWQLAAIIDRLFPVDQPSKG